MLSSIVKRLLKSRPTYKLQRATYCLKIESLDLGVSKDFCASKLKKPQLLPIPKYGGESFVTLLTGSTLIGETGAKYIKTLFDAVNVPVIFEHIPVGNSQEYITSVMRNRTALHVDLQHDPDVKAKTLLMNSVLGLYACIVKLQSYDGFNCRFPNLKLSIITQNISGDFSKLEYEPVKGIVETLKFCQDTEIKRYLELVFKYAVKHHHKKITFALQTRELPKTDGMFLSIANELQCNDYDEIEIEYAPVNKLARKLVMKPEIFDLICTNDRYGTFVTSIACSVCGGAGLFSALEIGDHHAVFKPLQTKLSLTDSRVLSPYGVIRASIELLLNLDYIECAKKLESELLNTMLVHQIKTEEFGGTNNGDFIICDVINRLKSCR